ncbi:MAG: VCBS repeat-containing protein [Planctomycetota bacterium]
MKFPGGWRSGVLLAVLFVGVTEFAHGQYSFRRGDVDQDAQFTIGDPVANLELLFVGGEITCLDVLDANDDGAADLADPVYLLAYLFGGGAEPAVPFQDCGFDTTADGLGCTGSIGYCFGLGGSTMLAPSISTSIEAEVADLNGDGLPDLLVAESGSGTGRVAIWLRLPRGGYGAPQGLPLASASDVVVADLDLDGDLDLVAVGTGGDYRAYTNDGAGVFSTSWTFSTWPPTFSIAVADCNSDGIPDLLYDDWSNLLFRPGTGSGDFGPATVAVPMGNTSDETQVADLNLDGIMDVVWVTFDSPTLGAALGNGDGTFSSTFNLPVGPPSSFSESAVLAIGDLNNDTFPDLVTSGTNPSAVRTYLGDGAGGFTFTSQMSIGGARDGVALGDIDFDGNLDVAAGRWWDGLTVGLGNGAGGFSFHGNYSLGTFTANPWFTKIVDADGDGDLDVLGGRANDGVGIIENLYHP